MLRLEFWKLEAGCRKLEPASAGPYGLLLVPMRTLAQLQHIGGDTAGLLVSTGMSICIHTKPSGAWKTGERKETPGNKVFAALEKVPPKFYDVILRALQDASLTTSSSVDLLPIAAFLYEFTGNLSTSPHGIIPNWDSVGSDLAAKHLSVFYLFNRPLVADLPAKLEQFTHNFGRERLFQQSRLYFRFTHVFIPIADYVFILAASSDGVASYDRAVQDILKMEWQDTFLSRLVSSSLRENEKLVVDPDIATQHYCQNWEDPRKYLFDWLVLVRVLRNPNLGPEIAAKSLEKLRRASRRGRPAQKFYSSLILKKIPSEICPNWTWP